MKTTLLKLIILCLLLSPAMLWGQSRVAVQGTNGIYMISDDYKFWGLEVNGSLVVDKKYLDFKSNDGKLFVVTALGGKKGVCDATGKFHYPCEYDQASVTKGTIMVKNNDDAKPTFYSTEAPQQKKYAKELTKADIEAEIERNSPPGTYLNINDIIIRNAMEKAAEVSLINPFGAHNFRVDKFGRMELMVNGKSYFVAEQFKLLYDEPDIYENSENGNTGLVWYYTVFNSFGGGMSGTYGVVILDIYNDKASGKTMVGCVQTIPYRPTQTRWYSYISVYHNSILKCTTNSGAPVYFTRMGQEVSWPEGINSGKAVFGAFPPSVKNFNDYRVR